MPKPGPRTTYKYSESSKGIQELVRVYLEVCEEKGITPTKEYSGKFNLRIPPRLHSEIAARATVAGKSINQWVSEILKRSTVE